MNVTFYSTHCPRCQVLQRKLDKKGIQYNEVNDVEIMKRLGMKSAPALRVDDQLMEFAEATKWVNAQEDPV